MEQINQIRSQGRRRAAQVCKAARALKARRLLVSNLDTEIQTLESILCVPVSTEENSRCRSPAPSPNIPASEPGRDQA